MVAENQLLENILVEITRLSPEFRLRLIQRITDSLLGSFQQPFTPIQFGKYKSNKLSTLEDFAIAEWHPTEAELNGN